MEAKTLHLPLGASLIPTMRKSLSQKEAYGSSVKLNGAPVMFKSGTQRHVALSVTETELYAAVNCAQGMLHCMHVLQSLDLTVNLPMILEIDNQGTVNLANNWSIVGQTRHIAVR